MKGPRTRVTFGDRSVPATAHDLEELANRLPRPTHIPAGMIPEKLDFSCGPCRVDKSAPPVLASYRIREGVLRLECPDCGRVIVDVAVAVNLSCKR